jgi:hypothetical protein
MTQPEFVAELRRARRALTERATTVLQAGAAMCATKLVTMALDKDMPPSIQLAAASRVLELAHRGEELQDIQAELAELREMLADVPAPKGLRAA